MSIETSKSVCTWKKLSFLYKKQSRYFGITAVSPIWHTIGTFGSSSKNINGKQGPSATRRWYNDNDSDFITLPCLLWQNYPTWITTECYFLRVLGHQERIFPHLRGDQQPWPLRSLPQPSSNPQFLFPALYSSPSFSCFLFAESSWIIRSVILVEVMYGKWNNS